MRAIQTGLVCMAALAALLVTSTAHAANWGGFQKDFCRGVSPPIRQYSAILWNIPGGNSWEDACKAQPADILGYHFDKPSRCVKQDPGIAMWGEFDVPDQACYLDADALAAQFLLPYARPHYCDPLPVVADPRPDVESWSTDGCSGPLTDQITKIYKDRFYQACVIHDYCYSMPWQGDQRLFCDNTFYNQMMTSVVLGTLSADVAATWYVFVRGYGEGGYTGGQGWANRHCTVFNWTGMPGGANDIGIGADGSVWVIGTGRVPGGYGIFRWGGATWEQVPGGAVAIDVGPDGQPWVVSESGEIFKRTNNAWVQVPGRARDIGIGADGSVWIVDMNPAPGGYRIRRKVGEDSWMTVSGGATRISGGSLVKGVLAGVVSSNGNIFLGTP